eukprot:GHVT01053223.1.p1 GENE.GHVT01053223.1~~GHVT01053223.1.p1  ORF type:complete len:281 (+),score=51.12 GHVT01053223.1:1269-2111(+)
MPEGETSGVEKANETISEITHSTKEDPDVNQQSLEDEKNKVQTVGPNSIEISTTHGGESVHGEDVTLTSEMSKKEKLTSRTTEESDTTTLHQQLDEVLEKKTEKTTQNKYTPNEESTQKENQTQNSQSNVATLVQNKPGPSAVSPAASSSSFHPKELMTSDPGSEFVKLQSECSLLESQLRMIEEKIMFLKQRRSISPSTPQQARRTEANPAAAAAAAVMSASSTSAGSRAGVVAATVPVENLEIRREVRAKQKELSELRKAWWTEKKGANGGSAGPFRR